MSFDSYVCWNCLEDEYLRKQMQEVAECSYCEETDLNCMSIEKLADHVKFLLESHFTYIDPNDQYLWASDDGMQVTDIIEGEAGVSVEIANDVVDEMCPNRRLDEYDIANPFMSDSLYEERTNYGSGDWHSVWATINRELKTKARFYNKTAFELFDEIFEDIGTYPTVDGQPIFKTIGAGNTFYRARCFHDQEKLFKALENPAKELGPPPKNAAAGRMNAFGISVFYGSTSPEVALAELKPAVGSSVVISKFELVKDVVLFDLNALELASASGSLFDPAHYRRLEKIGFLRTLRHVISVPVLPDNAATDYIITQAVADYLASSKFHQLDGIIYPSVQVRKEDVANIVLFHKSARASRDNELSYKVRFASGGFEDDPDELELAPVNQKKNDEQMDFDDDEREQFLQIDAGSIEVRQVSSVDYKSWKTPVHLRK